MTTVPERLNSPTIFNLANVSFVVTYSMQLAKKLHVDTEIFLSQPKYVIFHYLQIKFLCM